MEKETIPKKKVLDATVGMMQLQLYAIFTTPVDGKTGPLMQVLDLHLEYQRKLEREGILSGAGPFWTSDEMYAEGEGMIIVRAENIAEAQKIANQDPMHSMGARTYIVRPWLLNEGRLTINVSLSSCGAVLK